jgi:hypothetical protein
MSNHRVAFESDNRWRNDQMTFYGSMENSYEGAENLRKKSNRFIKASIAVALALIMSGLIVVALSVRNRTHGSQGVTNLSTIRSKPSSGK